VLAKDNPDKKEVILTTIDFPPYMDKSLVGNGLLMEPAIAAFKAAGVKTSVSYMPLKRVSKIEAEKIGFVHAGTIFNFSEKQKQWLEIRSILNVRLVLFYNKEKYANIDFTKIDELRRFKGKKMAHLRGGFETKLFKGYGFKLIQADSNKSLLSMLHANRVDFVSMVELTGLDSIDKHFPSDKDSFGRSSTAIITFPAQIIFSNKGNKVKTDNLLKDFDRGLKIIKENGIYKRALERYYGKGKIPIDVPI
jgi:ABC-type amino acid transport substrate-binding protein